MSPSQQRGKIIIITGGQCLDKRITRLLHPKVSRPQGPGSDKSKLKQKIQDDCGYF